MKAKEKTNVMRILEQKNIPYREHTYDSSKALSGTEVAGFLNQDKGRVFKTLVTVGKSGTYYVFLIPVAGELDLKLAAKSVGEKSIEMLPSKELFGLTGYIHGGCSPVGMKKAFKTTIHESAKTMDTIFFSGGKIGYQVEVSPKDLEKVIRFSYAGLICG